MTSKPLEKIVQELPPDIYEEVRDFAQFLLSKRTRRGKKTLRQNWAGALSKYRDQYTSVKLQHQAANWRDK
ncbi:MAG: DUF2281 domain-containing protein [Calditrichaeota bacterium]|nr:DUF2281 domain-containing protein [Calditrichota bacterium]